MTVNIFLCIIYIKLDYFLSIVYNLYKVDIENHIIKGCLVTHEGNIIHEMTKNIIEGDR